MEPVRVSTMAPRTCTHPGAVAPGHESQNATYGLTSSTGLPSTMSAPPTTRQPFPTDMISATLRPMGLGLVDTHPRRETTSARAVDIYVCRAPATGSWAQA